MLLVLGSVALVLAGCYSGPDPKAFDTPPIDASALSGGKITHFTPMPGLPKSPGDRAMLLACRQLPITSSTARSALLLVTGGQCDKFPLFALVVGKQVLILPGQVVRMGIVSGQDKGNFTFYPDSPQRIVFVAGSKTAYVGKTKVQLQYPVVATTTHDLVMNWADMLALLNERDRQRHEPPFIRNTQIVYNERDYHR